MSSAAISLALLATVALAYAQPVPQSLPPGEAGSISGTVRHGLTGQPLLGVKLTLRRIVSEGEPPKFELKSTSTDASGEYSFIGLTASQTYTVQAEKDGFATTSYGSVGRRTTTRVVALKSGARLSAIDIPLTPNAIISGRVFDEDRQPLVGLQVAILRYVASSMGTRLVPSELTVTNEKGEYSSKDLSAGRYLIRVLARRGPIESEKGEARTPDEVHVATYYPDAIDVQQATAFSVEPGMTLGGIDFKLRKQKTYRIRGRVVAEGLGDVTFGLVYLVPKGIASFPGSDITKPTAAGEFVIAHVLPGAYTLGVDATGKRSYDSQQEVVITDRNLENVELTLGQVFHVQGQVRVEEGSTPRPEGLRVRVQPDYGRFAMSGRVDAPVEAGGTFQFRDLIAVAHRLSVLGLPAGWYVKAMRVGNADVDPVTFVLPPTSAGSLEILISNKSGHISGSVINRKKEPVAEATVVLVRDPLAVTDLANARTIETGKDGRFEFVTVVPGKYKLYAWDDVEEGTWLDPTFLGRFEPSAKSVDIRESDRLQAEIAVMSGLN